MILGQAFDQWIGRALISPTQPSPLLVLQALRLISY
jgi:hypothetical protein